MGHDELLARIKNELAGAEFDAMCNSGGQVEAVKALCAVVELHKPRNYKAGNWCIGCNADYQYPCPTIQAIEKELE